MDFKSCRLYGIQSKKSLCELLNLTDKKMLKQSYLINLVEPYIDISSNGKERLIEVPKEKLKTIQTRIKICFYDLNFPEYVFSGVKGRSYIDNAKFHMGDNYLYKLDFTAFFPFIKRDVVFKFFRNKLNMSADVANIMANITTVDLEQYPEDNTIVSFLNKKEICTKNHLISGSPSSQVLSYLVNIDMFNELYSYGKGNNIIMTIYVDDIFFSSKEKISNRMILYIKKIISKYGYKVSSGKEKYYTRNYPKEVTGVIIDKKGKFAVKNTLSKNIIDEFMKLSIKSEVLHDDKKRLQGLTVCATQIDKPKYEKFREYAFKKE